MLKKALINAAALLPTGGALTTGSSAQAGYGFGWAFDRPIGRSAYGPVYRAPVYRPAFRPVDGGFSLLVTGL